MKTQDKPRDVESLSIQGNLHRKRLFQWIFSMVALLLALPVFAASPRTFSFVVPNSSKTSGGVYDSAGTLIRTLWSGRSYNAGTYSVA
ncbi:MAG: hypothetical protein H7Y36_01020, partial [Armatimonadetes bacterium]|nr:hypothetical protein [Akkermansiaceae bacterium]